MPYSIPDKLNTYFKNHLHLIAELQSEDDTDDGLKFGIFFTTREPQKNGDPLFKGSASVEGHPEITKPSWNNKHTLFLLPLSEEAEKSLVQKEIRFDRLRFTNAEAKGGHYNYLYISPPQPEDVYLELDETRQLGIIKDKWHLYILNSDGGKEQFPVVIIDKDFESSERLFYFEAPGCLMHKEYNTHY